MGKTASGAPAAFLRELLLINKPEFSLVLLVLWNHWACAAQLVTSNVEIARLTD